MRVRTIVIEFTGACIHEVPTQLGLVVQLEVLNVPQHLLSGLEVHLLLLPWLLPREVVCHRSVPRRLVFVERHGRLRLFCRHFFGVLLLYIPPDIVPE